MIPKPATILTPSKLCEWCGRPSETQCSKCKQFVFCKRSCLQRLWPRHKYVCRRMKDIVMNPEASTLYGVGDTVWEASQRRLDSARIKHLREMSEDDPKVHPDYLLCMPEVARKIMIEYMDVKSLCRLDSVVNNVYTLMAWHGALRGTYSRALDHCNHCTNKENFACLKWGMQRRMVMRDIPHLRVYDGRRGDVMVDKGEIFRWLCARKRFADIACFLVINGLIDANHEVEGYSLLCIASEHGHEDIVGALIEKGGDIDKATAIGWGSVYIAAMEGHVEILRILLEKGADVDQATIAGVTPLATASDYGDVEVMKVLLEAGADANSASYDGKTPLYVASVGEHVEAVKILLESGADVNLATRDGKTPLFVSSEYGSVEVVRVLLEAGADMRKGTNDGSTPLSIATEQGHDEVVRLLSAKLSLIF